jgi:nucleoside-specific outer membrane channel protein Tsx
MKIASRTPAALALLALASISHAADWSDTSIGFRTGSKYAEPFGSNDIKKQIVNFTHASGYKYGSNFFNVDYLQSNSKDPAFAGASDGAKEVYIVYRHTLELDKISGAKMNFGPIRNYGLTFGFDVNTKDDAGYNSKKRMLVIGPTVMFDVPGFLNVSTLWLKESNAPYSTYSSSGVPRYNYKGHAMLTAAWGIFPFKDVPVSFEGFFNYIGTKGKNEFGGPTAPETNFDGQVMYDVGSLFGAKGLKLGLEYQYWKNKFGNDRKGPAGSGAFAKTPMIRAEYHF